MKINQIVQETTTAGSIAPGAQHGFVKMQTRSPSVYGSTKAGNLLKGKKTNKPFANSVNESAELSEADLQEDDIIVLPGQGRKLKTGFVPHGKSRVDHEVEMARSDVLATMKNARSIYELLKNKSEEEGLEGWVQEKLVKANDYLNSVKEYYDEKMIQQESVPPAGVIGNGAMGEGKDDVDSLVTDTEAVMKKFQIDAEQALKIVLGDREYNSRRSFYSFYIRQIIARSKQQGMSEGHTEVKDKQGKVVSWKDDTEWHKAEKNKQGQPKDPRGVVTHLSDVARRKTASQQGLAEEEEDKMDSRFKKTEWMPLMDAIKILKHYGATPEKYMGHEMFPYYDIEGNRKYLEDITWNADNSKNVRVSLVNQAVRELKAQQQALAEGGQVHGQPQWQLPVKPEVQPYSPGKPMPQSLQQKLDGKPNTGRAVDDKGRTQQQWMKLVKAKFPDAKIMQSKMPEGPVFAMLSDGRKLSWNKVEQSVSEGKIDFAKKLGKNIDKSNKAVVKTKKEVGSRVADIGAGGKEYNVKTDKAWDDAQKTKKAK